MPALLNGILLRTTLIAALATGLIVGLVEPTPPQLANAARAEGSFSDVAAETLK